MAAHDSSQNRREVWITGLGVVSAFGTANKDLLVGLAENRTSSSYPWAFEPAGLPIRAMAELRQELPSLPGFEDDRKISLLFQAAENAVKDASLQAPLGRNTGVFLGTGLSSVTPRELAEDIYPFVQGDRFDRVAIARDLHVDHVAPHRHLPSRASHALSARWGAEGPLHTSFSACAAGAHAMGAAFHAIRRGDIDLALAGGHDSMTHPIGMLSFLVLGTLCDDACRPFDRRRNGFLLGEGAAILVIEAAEHAMARGAAPLARFLGAGSSLDAHAVTAPHPEGHGARLAMIRALADAALPASCVDYVNAHGTGTHVGDRAESLAISGLFHGGVPVCSLKGAIGHTIAAAGAVELAGSILAMREGFIPATTGCSEPDPECPINVILEPIWRTPRYILSNSFGFGGQNASLLIGHPDTIKA